MKTSWMVATTLLASACQGGASDARDGGGDDREQRVLEVPATRALSSATPVVAATADGAVDKVDLLLMIDNSISMSDKQQILANALPDLMSRLVNPACVDEQGNVYPPPPEGSSECPSGQHREFQPIGDIHVGIISSSLGDGGANAACPGEGFERHVPDRLDMSHLLGSLERSQAETNAFGFLEWQAGSTDPSEFNRNFQQLVQDVGEQGCGWEAQLESWYRFLVDPVPYQALMRATCPGSASTAQNCIQRATGPDGRFLLDETLLAQRDAFLRPDSLVAIVMLTDENDCSLQVGAQSWTVFAIEDQRPMFKGSSVCAEDPNAQCCYSCPLSPPKGCAPDPSCSADPSNLNRLPLELDGQNLRCFEQKRRFGIDFLYPTQRYVNALTQAELCWSADDLSLEDCDEADLFPNPLFAGGRSADRVLLAGIVGVPRQALETAEGVAEPGGSSAGVRFKSYEELTRDGVWDQILGSPGVPWQAREGSRPAVSSSPPVPPTLAQMVESPLPRAGVEAGNPLNGREYDTTQDSATQVGSPLRADDLQYACISPLPVPRDCAALDPEQDNCDCFEDNRDRPLCEQVPGVTAPGT
ncbi:MAG TPA: hypothetical protein VJU61_21175, partial [Polyangiaceae bacterium]|nr:hypothetical protein [Polyangiaceae bacterium]